MSTGFKSGQIVELTLERFMVYTKATTIKFQPRMNVIMGVNGSGKSSIFVGLIVGLGGDLKVLNRQNNFLELINRNSKSANIVIMLVIVNKCLFQFKVAYFLFLCGLFAFNHLRHPAASNCLCRYNCV